MPRFLLAPIVLFTLTAVLAATPHAQAPGLTEAADYLQRTASELGLGDADLQDLILLDAYQTRHSGVTHVYVQQRFEGVPVHNAIASVAFRADGTPLAAPHRFVADLADAVESRTRALDAPAAAAAAAAAVELAPDGPFLVEEHLRGSDTDVLLSPAGISIEPIPAELRYVRLDSGALRLAWIVGIYQHGADHYWSVSVDAASGAILRTVDLVVHDHWGEPTDDEHAVMTPLAEAALAGTLLDASRAAPAARPAGAADGASYRVYAMPYESPSHAGNPMEDHRQVAISPGTAVASPLGWHDTGSQTYTITRGNNAHAYMDAEATNSPDPGGEPDGGATLTFDFPLDFIDHPGEYADAAVTNLFYWNNVSHDLLYAYGFDEPAGNFQQNNFGLGGLGGDYVRAEAQDGGGTNNANFFTPPDGQRPRMQMYLWGVNPRVVVTQPQDIAGQYVAGIASFGPRIDVTGIGGTVAAAVDDTGSTLACSPITTNAAAINGNIALIDRGVCPFVEKVMHAQNAGAIGVIIANNEGGVITMGGSDPNITIPTLMVSQADGNTIRNRLPAGVEATLRLANSPRDSDFDNGVIVHEYVHGLTHRLTGGPSTTSCLSNAQQAGEGWSDWYALMMTGGDVDHRGIATYLRFQMPSGTGIRPARYSTSMTINPYTFGNIGSLSVPHGVGFVFASMLWEMTQGLIAEHGYDPDLYTGTGGNNIALQLVTDALKLQPCEPGFVDSRDAILLADEIMNDGANQCIIWDAFAKRGLGYSADQGSPFSTTGVTQAFDLPEACQAVSTDDGASVDVLALAPAYPNPSAGAVTVSFQLPTAGAATLEVIDLLGRRVALLVDDTLPAGAHEVVWSGTELGAGTYVIRLRAGSEQLTQRVTLVR